MWDVAVVAVRAEVDSVHAAFDLEVGFWAFRFLRFHAPGYTQGGAGCPGQPVLHWVRSMLDSPYWMAVLWLGVGRISGVLEPVGYPDKVVFLHGLFRPASEGVFQGLIVEVCPFVNDLVGWNLPK